MAVHNFAIVVALPYLLSAARLPEQLPRQIPHYDPIRVPTGMNRLNRPINIWRLLLKYAKLGFVMAVADVKRPDESDGKDERSQQVS